MIAFWRSSGARARRMLSSFDIGWPYSAMFTSHLVSTQGFTDPTPEATSSVSCSVRRSFFSPDSRRSPRRLTDWTVKRGSRLEMAGEEYSGKVGGPSGLSRGRLSSPEGSAQCASSSHTSKTIRGERAGPKEATTRARMITLRNRAKEGEGRFHVIRLGRGAKKRPPTPIHALFVDQAPNVKPFLSHLTRTIVGKTTVSHRGKSAMGECPQFPINNSHASIAHYPHCS